MSQELILSKESREVAIQLNSIVSQIHSLQKENGFIRAIGMANAINQITLALTDDVMKPMMSLMGKKIGFLSDKKYIVEIVRNVFIEATFFGLQITGNHFNIIAEKMYPTREGFTYLLATLGNWHKITPSLPKKEGARTIVDSLVEWKNDRGEICKETLSFPIRVNEGMGDDAILGKSERKCKKWLYYQLTGIDLADGEVEDVIVTVVETKTNESKPEEKSSNSNEGNAKNESIENAEVVSESKKVSDDKQEKCDKFLAIAITLSDLEVRWKNMLAREPNLSDKFFEQRKAELSNK